MHQLLLLRHAKAVREVPGQPDRDRPLAPRGQRDAAALGRTMRRLGLTPDLVLVSPALRTRQTLAALEPWDETPLVEVMDPLYLADDATLAALLAEVPETVRSLLLIGHNPGLHGLARRLAVASPGTPLETRFPTAALAEFALPGRWDRATGARLIRFLLPASDS
ncbi:MAG: SixA phosphatase family protein [Acetobacteraceae bacterium]